MDPQTLFNVALGIITGGLGWFARQLWEAIQKLRADLSELSSDIPAKYLSKDDYRVDLGRIHEMLDRIYAILMGKQR